MELNRKTIQINPDLFKINGGNTTRKNKENKEKKQKIRMKTEKPKKLSTIKKNILKMIRNQQDERRKHLKEKQKENDLDLDLDLDFIDNQKSSSIQEFQNKFNDSLDFLSNLTKEVDNRKQDYTIKRYPSISPEPTYGCLKNGKLPTYRTWINQTRKNVPLPSPQPLPIMPLNPIIYTQPQPQPQIIQKPFIPPPPQQFIIQNQNSNPNQNPLIAIEKKKNDPVELIKQFSKIQQFEKKNNINSNSNLNLKKWKYPKQKKTIRRTYYVGKSRIHPRVSVLVSNKTIRAKTTLKQQELKQVPITEVRKYLLKHGFIKVGTSSPNDVLREMYESAQLICGEIKNHNSENLLYNYFNTPSEP
jgi:hypothetical protein